MEKGVGSDTVVNPKKPFLSPGSLRSTVGYFIQGYKRKSSIMIALFISEIAFLLAIIIFDWNSATLSLSSDTRFPLAI
jgi:hypothetical protein